MKQKTLDFINFCNINIQMVFITLYQLVALHRNVNGTTKWHHQIHQNGILNELSSFDDDELSLNFSHSEGFHET